MRKVLLVLGTLMILGVLGTAPASAHAALVKVSPTNAETLTSAPSKVVLTFDENIRTPSKIIVTGPSGRVDTGSTEIVDGTVSVAVKLAAEPSYVGTYRVAYRVVSADGHPVSGESSFRYQPADVQPAPASSTTTQQDSGSDSGPSYAVWWVVGGIVLVLGVAVVLLRPRRRMGR